MNVSKAFFIGLLTLVAIVLGVVFPVQRGIVAVVWTLWIFAYGLNELRAAVRRLIRPHTSAFERVIAPALSMRGRPQDLIRCEHAMGWRVYDPRDFDHHVRPLLSELVHDRVRRRYGIGLDALPEAVRQSLDPDLLALVSDRSSEEIYGHNLRTHHIVDIVDRIERLP